MAFCGHTYTILLDYFLFLPDISFPFISNPSLFFFFPQVSDILLDLNFLNLLKDSVPDFMNKILYSYRIKKKISVKHIILIKFIPSKLSMKTLSKKVF